MKTTFKTAVPLIAPYKLESLLNQAVLKRNKVKISEAIFHIDHVEMRVNNLEGARNLPNSLEGTRLIYTKEAQL